MNFRDDEELRYDQLRERINMNTLIFYKKFEDVNKALQQRVYSFIPLMLSSINIVA